MGLDLRGVNGKGLDLRLRLPDGIEGLEPALRPMIARAVARGNVSLSLRLSRVAGSTAPRLDPVALEATLAALWQIERAAADRGLTLAPARSSEILGLRGLLDSGADSDADSAPLLAALLADVPALLAAFNAMRATEGQALAETLGRQIDAVAALVDQAAVEAEARRPQAQATLRDALARVMEAAPGADPDRVAQELALLAVKSDVTEEIDRLRAHVTAARTLLAAAGPVGRKLDFLMQEFNREANTLCAKAQSVGLTRLGLDLKAVIDQMREQVQNVE